MHSRFISWWMLILWVIIIIIIIAAGEYLLLVLVQYGLRTLTIYYNEEKQRFEHQ